MQKYILIIGALAAALAVGLGAFGAHALSGFLENSGRQDTYETAVKYQFYHSLALLLIGAVMFRIEDALLPYAGMAMILGIIFFSGSLYLICFTGAAKLGMVAPVGGLLFIIGWLLLAGGIYRGL